MSEIKVTCKTELNLSLEEIHPVQGELKILTEENYEKLKRSILTNGFNFPLFVWKEEDKWWLLDGHARLRLIGKLQEEGYIIPKLPCVEVEAKDLVDAKKKVLLISSHYHTMTSDGLYEFMSDVQMPFEELAANYSLTEINLDRFNLEYFDSGDLKLEEEPESTELDRGSFTKFSQECPKCGFSFDSKEEDEAVE